jgi:hypothetical protein
MSLWSVSSKETAKLMTDFFIRMSEGKSKAEALREAKLNMMKKNPHPFYWGPLYLWEIRNDGFDDKGSQSKPYQVKQVCILILKYKLRLEEENLPNYPFKKGIFER